MTVATTTEQDTAIDVLRRLYRAEGDCLLPHLERASPHVSQRVIALGELMRKVVARRVESIRWLGGELYTLGTSPPAIRPPIEYAEMAYLTYEYLLPTILRDVARLLGIYREQQARLSGNRLAEPVAKLADALEEDLRQMETWRDRIIAKSGRLNVSVDPNVLGAAEVQAAARTDETSEEAEQGE